MERQVNYFIIGISIIALILGMMGFVIWLTKFHSGRGFMPYVTYFTTASGLKPGSSVQYHGIHVGEVTNVRVDPHNIEQIEVEMKIDDNIIIKQDAYATIRLQGIAGSFVVAIEGGTQEASPLIAHKDMPPVIPSRPSPDIFEQLSQFLDNAEAFLDENNRRAVATTLNNLEKITTTLANDQDGLPAISKSVSQISQNMVQYFDPQTPNKQIMANLNESISQARNFFTSFDTLIKNSRQPIEDFANTGLYELTQAIIELRAFMDKISRLSAAIEQDPGRFLFGNQQEGYKVPQ